jgi:type I restriction enzyme S subunit
MRFQNWLRRRSKLTANILQKISETSSVGQNEIPEGWELVRLPDVCEINPPKPSPNTLAPDAPVTFVPMPAVDADRGAITKPETREFGKVRKGYTSFRDDDVIMAKITPCMENGKAAIAQGLQNGLGFGSTEFHVFRSNGAVLADFLYHFIRQEAFRKTAENEMTGSVGQKRVPASFLETVEIRLPPLAEQKRIVAKIEELLARVNTTRERLSKVPAILKQFRQAVLAAACSGRLTQNWRDENPDIETASVSLQNVLFDRRRGVRQKYREPLRPEGDLPALEEKWVWATIDQLRAPEPNSITDGPFGSNLKTAHYTAKGPRVIRLQNVGEGVFIDEEAHISQDHFENLLKHKILSGDLAIATLGDPIPRACLIGPEVGPAIVKADVIRFKPNLVLCESRYLCYALNDEATRARLAERVHGVSRPRLNLSEVKTIPLPLPPLQEQREIVRRVEKILAICVVIEKRHATATTRVEHITDAIFNKAFRGELVLTEADLARRERRSYEPASELLARVKSLSNSSKSGLFQQRQNHAHGID